MHFTDFIAKLKVQKAYGIFRQARVKPEGNSPTLAHKSKKSRQESKILQAETGSATGYGYDQTSMGNCDIV